MADKPSRPPWPQHLRESWIQLVGGAAPIAGGLSSAYGLHRLPLFLVGSLAVLLLIDRIVYSSRDRAPFRRRHGLAKAGRVVRPVLALLAGAAVALALWVAVPQVARLVSPPPEGCESLPEARVMAAPELYAAVRSAADEFAERAPDDGRDGCAPGRVTVFEAPPAARMDAVFKGTWEFSEQPRPDLWVPATSAAVAAATGGEPRPEKGMRAGDTKVRLWAGGNFGAPSPLVLAVSRRVAEDLGLSETHPISLDGVTADIDRLLVPRPPRRVPRPAETESELAGMLMLFGGSTGDDGKSRSRRREIVNLVDRDITVPSDPGALLCRLRALDKDHGTTTAAIVPLSSVEVFNSGAPCGASVLPQQEQLVPMRPGWAPAIDRPIVRVRWDGADPEGHRLADRFAGWLARHGPPPVKGPSGPTLTRDHLAQSRALMANAQRELSIEFMLDYSETMNGRTGTGTRLTDAVTLIENALDRLSLNPGNQVGLWRFPGGAGGRAPAALVPRAPADPAQAERIKASLDGLRRADADTTPLFHAIAVAAGQGTGRRTLVVLTDGKDDDPGRRGGTSARQELEDALDDPGGPQVYVVALTGAGCGRDLTSLEQAHSRFHCLKGDRNADAILNALFSAP
ncbi:hypothetical protein [Actinomadura sp. 3N508]|uniref:hypothetical protein n=1 Tax=Actinomadura sp. 3N508 TaxID=3375153 RepID=UPI0037AE5440